MAEAEAFGIPPVPGAAAGNVPVFNAAGGIADSGVMHLDAANNQLRVGYDPATRVFGNVSTFQGKMQGANCEMRVSTAGPGSNAYIAMDVCRGTFASPQPCQTNDYSSLVGAFYDPAPGTGLLFHGIQIFFRATENHSSANHGAQCEIWGIANGSTTQQLVFTAGFTGGGIPTAIANGRVLAINNGYVNEPLYEVKDLAGNVIASLRRGDGAGGVGGGNDLVIRAFANIWLAPNNTDAGAVQVTPTDVKLNGASLKQVFPKRATLWQDDAIVTNGNALAIGYDTTSFFNLYAFQNPPANGDSFTQGFLLAAGTYSFEVIGTSGPNRGQWTWTLDGTPIVSNQDWYSSGNVPTVMTSTGIAVATSGWHVLTGTATGKNGSSSNYFSYFQKISFRPTSD